MKTVINVKMKLKMQPKAKPPSVVVSQLILTIILPLEYVLTVNIKNNTHVIHWHFFYLQ